MAGPLQGTSIVELAGIGPAPFCAMVLADLGADVIRIDRPARPAAAGPALGDGMLTRGRRSVAIDLKHSDGAALALELIGSADALIEGFRPGVMERLGLGPEPCLERNPRLVYGRLTGYGQQGPLAQRAGHDIDYVALAGVLGSIGSEGGGPVVPLNLVADFGGGSMVLATGILAALLETSRSGAGQVVDAAMLDGSAYLMTMMYELLAAGAWTERRGTNFNDGAAPFYATYATADGEYLAVGALEPKFWTELVELLGLEAEAAVDHWRPERWPQLRSRLAEIFATRTRAEWERRFADSDACVVPVLAMSDAPDHPHARQRGTFVDVDGHPVPAPAPRFERTPGPRPEPARAVGADTDAVLAEHGVTDDRIAALRASGVVG